MSRAGGGNVAGLKRIRIAPGELWTMNFRTWVGLILVGQAGAFLPIRALYADKWLYLSLGLAFVGLFVLFFRRAMHDGWSDDSPGSHCGSEYGGSQSRDLTIAIGDGDD